MHVTDDLNTIMKYPKQCELLLDLLYCASQSAKRDDGARSRISGLDSRQARSNIHSRVNGRLRLGQCMRWGLFCRFKYTGAREHTRSEEDGMQEEGAMERERGRERRGGTPINKLPSPPATPVLHAQTPSRGASSEVNG
jgi:hypothetical protein